MFFNQRLTLLLALLLIILEISLVQSYPQTQKIVVHGHEWTVPDEPGWHEGKFALVGRRFSSLIPIGFSFGRSGTSSSRSF